jgi:ribose-phosphate pyrophosphokinase
VKNILALSILKSNKAKKIDMLIPYMVYARQDKVFQPGEPLSIAVLANIYDSFGVSNIYTIASHLYGKDETTKTHRTLRSFFKAHVHDISPIKLFADYLKNIACIVDPFIIVPDEGGRRIGCELADALKCRWGYFTKVRDPATGKIIEMAPANMKPEDVNGKSVVILDDVTASGNTIEEAHLKTNEYFKPKEEYAAVGHVINENTVNKLYNCGFKEVLTTDSLATSPYTSVEYKKNELSFSKQKYFTEISVAGLLGDYIKSTSKT